MYIAVLNCKMYKMKDLIDFGKKYGKLTIIEELKPLRLPSGQTNRILKCKCDCGNYKNIRWAHLKRNKISSCGCITKTRNGLGDSSICKVWRQMKDRTSENSKQYNYIKKNIKTCKEWIESFESFYNWAINNGYKKGLQIDRINNLDGYYPENCRWVTPKENCNNREVTLYVNYNNKKISLKMLLLDLGRENDYSTIYRRIKRGWEHQKAIDVKIKDGNYKRIKRF